MSLHPLFDPNSVNNESLNIYCHNLTTSAGNSGFTVLSNHQNLLGYVGNDSNNGGVNILGDQQQLVEFNNNCVKISGRLFLRITIGGNPNIIILFSKPPSIIDKEISGNLYIGGSGFFSNNTNATFLLSDITTILFNGEFRYALNFTIANRNLLVETNQNALLYYSFSYKTL
jgi:hypothetical protein